MTHLFWMSNEAWAAIDPHLPRGKPGKPRVDDRRVISGIQIIEAVLHCDLRYAVGLQH